MPMSPTRNRFSKSSLPSGSHEKGKTLRYRHVITAAGPESHRGASAVRMDGKWVEFARYSYTRKAAANAPGD